jgi:hypothetical protein
MDAFLHCHLSVPCEPVHKASSAPVDHSELAPSPPFHLPILQDLNRVRDKHVKASSQSHVSNVVSPLSSPPNGFGTVETASTAKKEQRASRND